MTRKSIFLIPLIIFSACKKKDEPAPSSDEKLIVRDNAYYPLAIGNYWVYEHYQVLKTGEENKLHPIDRDSIAVSRDTLINGKKYAVLEGKNSPFTYASSVIDCVRDSAGYLINSHHDILFSSVNFTDTLGRFYNDDTINKFIYSSVWWMDQIEQTLQVPAGTFDCIVKKTRRGYNFYERQDERSEVWRSCYAKGIGPVMLEYNYQYAIGISKNEKRLVRYRAQSRDE
jgi:hypothetical protein